MTAFIVYSIIIDVLLLVCCTALTVLYIRLRHQQVQHLDQIERLKERMKTQAHDVKVRRRVKDFSGKEVPTGKLNDAMRDLLNWAPKKSD